MDRKWLVLLLVALVWIWPGSAVAEIDSSTTFRLDLTNANEAAKKAKWSEPDRIAVRPEGLGWGQGNEQGSRDVWLQTEAIGIGLSWRPTSMAFTGAGRSISAGSSDSARCSSATPSGDC